MVQWLPGGGRAPVAQDFMNITICWSAPSGYWGACWRALAASPDVRLHVIAFRPPAEAPFDEAVFAGLDYTLLDERERGDAAHVERLVVAQRPDVIQFVGWFVPAYRHVALSPRLRGVRKYMSLDTPWRHSLQRLTRLRYPRYLAALDGVGVTGERSWQYARRLGFPESAVRRNMYSVDDQTLGEVYASRTAGSRPRSFLFTGRYARVKAIDVLVAAYGRYRRSTPDPWPLVCCGGGELSGLLAGVEGIVDRGFVQPRDMPAVWREAGVFVLPSRFDPWPLVLVEAAQSGLPVIATNACGSAVEVLRHLYNGFIVPTDDPSALAAAMAACHGVDLALWGERARAHALGFTAALWAERWLELFATRRR
jgi:glycosyltransferase involved in cell wall biosynthesis